MYLWLQETQGFPWRRRIDRIARETEEEEETKSTVMEWKEQRRKKWKLCAEEGEKEERRRRKPRERRGLKFSGRECRIFLFSFCLCLLWLEHKAAEFESSTSSYKCLYTPRLSLSRCLSSYLAVRTARVDRLAKSLPRQFPQCHVDTTLHSLQNGTPDQRQTDRRTGRDR